MDKPIRTEDISNLTEDQALGQIIDCFQTRNLQLKRWLPLVTGSVLIFVGIGLIINLILTTIFNFQAHGPAILLPIIPFPFTFFLLLIIGGVISIILTRIHWRNCIKLYENGLIKHIGTKSEVWYYDHTVYFDNNITQILFGGLIVGERVKILLEDGSNQVFTIPNRYNRMKELVSIVRQRVLPGLYQRARYQLKNGQSSRFNDSLLANDKGLEIKEQSIPYDAVSIKINQQTLKIYNKKEPQIPIYKSPIARIRNLDLLLNLIENHPTPNY